MAVLLKRNLLPFSECWSGITGQDTRCSCVLWGLSYFSYYEVYQKRSSFPAPPLEREGRGEAQGGQWPKIFLCGLLLCPSSALFLLLIRKPAFPACVCEGSTADTAWRQQSSGSSRKTENDKKKKPKQTKYSSPEGTSQVTQPSLLLPRSPPSLNHGAAKAALKDSTQDWLLPKTGRPIFQPVQRLHM